MAQKLGVFFSIIYDSKIICPDGSLPAGLYELGYRAYALITVEMLGYGKAHGQAHCKVPSSPSSFSASD